MSASIKTAALAMMMILPRLDAMKEWSVETTRRVGLDDQLAPIWAEKLRHTYTKILEERYADLLAEAGDILPIDTSVDPEDELWVYYKIEEAGYADWISDDGTFAPGSAIMAKKETGVLAEMAHEWDLTIFDAERAAKAGLAISNIKGKVARRAHAAKTNWTWFFGDSGKNLLGLYNHPSIPIMLAPLNVGATSRLIQNKTNDEVATDFASIVDTMANTTAGRFYTGELHIPRTIWQNLRNRRLGAGDGFASLLDLLRDRYKGDDSGQGKVTFKIVPETRAAERRNPKTGTDTSGIDGDFIFAKAAGLTVDEAAFIRARPFTQRPPREDRFVVYNLSHSKIGGAKIQQPYAFLRFDFGVT